VKDLPVVNQPVKDMTPVGTFVALYSSISRKQIPSAFGYICDKTTDISPVIGAGDNAKKIKNPKRKTVSFIRVVRVMIPGLLLDQYEAPDVTLNSFGPDPFVISVRSSSLRTANASIQLSENPQQQQSDIPTPSPISSTITNDTTQQNISENDNSEAALQPLPSRVLKDAFHLMDMLKIPMRHGMSKDFMRRFRDCLFVIDAEDKKNVEAYLESIGSTWDTYMVERPHFILERVRRCIPPANELLPVVKLLFEKYGPAKCLKTGLPLFDKEAYDTAQRILNCIELGHVSDIPGGPPLYTEMGTDVYGLMRYRCSRGTNSVEGSVHMNIVRKFASYNAGPHLTDMALADYRLCHNLDVSYI
jgi:hypothetical protein